MSKERPILFSGPMVRALLDGRKTQTRRVWKMPRGCEWYAEMGGEAEGWFVDPDQPWWLHVEECRPPHGRPGDRLWVRESFAHIYRGNVQPEKRAPEDVAYMADKLTPDPYVYGSWKPSIHMPRWASRITLEITSVRVERLQDISDADCVSEGCGALPAAIGCPMTSAPGETIPRAMFRALWESINGTDSWAANPWVWAIEFRRLP